jgi:radical SAM superfamily enzyme YgiQ (UPF0313 family)
MKILLVYPRYPDTFWSFKYALKFVSIEAAFPPLGALTVASMLPGEWEKKLIDMNVYALTDKDIQWADYVFISAMVVQKESTLEVIRRCNRMNIKVVAGGPLFTTEPEGFSGADHLILNEAEVTLPPFLTDLEKGSPKRVYSTNIHPPITSTPAPMWSLIKMKKYSSMNLQYSRGCRLTANSATLPFWTGVIPGQRLKSRYWQRWTRFMRQAGAETCFL